MFDTGIDVGSSIVKANELTPIINKFDNVLVIIRSFSANSMTIDAHEELLTGTPYYLMAKEFHKLKSIIITTDSIDSLINIGLLPGWENVTFKLIIGFGVYHEFDNNKNKLEMLAHTIKYSEISDRFNLWFVQGWDLYSNTDVAGNVTRSVYYKNSLSILPSRQLAFFLCNPYVLDEIKTIMPEARTEYYSIYPYRITDHPIAHAHPKFFNSCPRLIDRPRTRKIICLNNAVKFHRETIVKIIQQYDKRDYYLTLREKRIFLETEEKQKSPDIIQSCLQDFPPIRHISDAYVYIATETYACAYDDSFPAGFSDIKNVAKLSSWWSEKTFKAIYYELPFMVVGFPRVLEYLKDLGFQTFPELFDESYDSVDRFVDKLPIYEKNINKIMSMSYDDLHNFYYSDATQHKLKHNKELFFKLLDDSPFTDVCNDIFKIPMY